MEDDFYFRIGKLGGNISTCQICHLEQYDDEKWQIESTTNLTGRSLELRSNIASQCICLSDTHINAIVVKNIEDTCCDPFGVLNGKINELDI